MTREWWFEDEMDEVIPEGLADPAALFSVAPDGTIKGRRDVDCDPETPEKIFSPGDTVSLVFCDWLGRRSVDFRPDGTFNVATGEWPQDATWIVADSDGDRGGDSLEELARFEAENEPGEHTEIVEFYFWSGEIRFRIVGVADSKVALACEEPEKLERAAWKKGDAQQPDMLET